METRETDLIVSFQDDGLPGHQHRASGVGLDGAIYTATVLTNEGRRCRQQMFAKSVFDRQADCLVRKYAHGELVAQTLVKRQKLVVNFIQPVADGFLLVGARSRLRRSSRSRSGSGEPNAAIYGWDGTLRDRFCLGDGIADVRTIPDRAIWVSYFDEGVFGNFGWGQPPGPEPIGRNGLVRFDLQGRSQWEYDPEEASTDMIVDAYSTNLVSKREVWIYFYTEFPIVRIRDKRYDVWACEHGGSNALAVDQGRALLFGGYGRKQIAHVVKLGSDGRTEKEKAFRVTKPGGGSLEWRRVYGVGKKLVLFTENGAYCLVDW